ncbi:MAG: NAD(P)H-dependent oxidoreductase [Haliscomenobacter sp.]|nr:NAD(P)H-dependent oxidoreductase [Haliscomenobacter sp.]
MITVISGTNRKNNDCRFFAAQYAELLRKHAQEEVRVLFMEEIPYDWIHPDMYEENGQSSSLARLQDEFLIPADKVVYVTPEYNGSYPGVVKLFLDACSVRLYGPTFKGKKAALVGVASGRAGNLRGMDHLTGVLHHVGTVVMPAVLPISRIGQILNKSGEIADPATLEAMEKHAKAFLEF